MCTSSIKDKDFKESVTHCENESANVVAAYTPSQFCYFRPQIFYQKVASWHIVDSALDIKMNFETGENLARFLSEVNPDDGCAAVLQQTIMIATRIVPASVGKDDATIVISNVAAAATWGDHEQIAYLFRSCYVTEDCALQGFGEACSGGFPLCVKVFLNAGVDPSRAITMKGRNALHLCCDGGHEECAKLVIEAMSDIHSVYRPDLDGSTAFDLLRRLDLSGMARRLEAHAQYVFN